MANLEKLNKTINELENHSKQIKATSDALREIKGLYKAIEDTNANQDKVNHKIEEISVKLQDVNKDMLDSYYDFSQQQNALNDHFQKALAQLGVSSKKSFEEMQEKIEELNNIQRDINHQLIENVKLVSSENTRLYLDQKQFLENQLDLNLSEVKVLSTKTKESFSEAIMKIEGKILSLESKLNLQEEESKKYHKSIKLLVGLTIGIGLINIVLRFI